MVRAINKNRNSGYEPDVALQIIIHVCNYSFHINNIFNTLDQFFVDLEVKAIKIKQVSYIYIL